MSAEVGRNPNIELLNADLSAESSWSLLFQAGEMLVDTDVFPDTGSRLRAEEYLGRMFDLLENEATDDHSMIRIRDLMYVAGTELRAVYGDRDLLDYATHAGTIACVRAVQAGTAIDTVRQCLATVFLEQRINY